MFRPTVRLKTALYALVLLVIGLSVLALNAASSAMRNSVPGVRASDPLSTIPTHDTPADSDPGRGVAQGKDAHLVDQEIQRSFEEPDFALLAGTPPHRIGCDIPLRGDGAAENEEGVLVFLGIFSAAGGRARRDL